MMRLRKKIAPLLLAVTGLLIPMVQHATAATAVLTPTIDLYSDQLSVFDLAYLDVGYEDFVAPGAVGSDKRAVMKFDLSSVTGPVTSATLTLNQITQNNFDPQFGFVELRSIGTAWTGASTAQQIFDVAFDANSAGLISFSLAPSPNGAKVLSNAALTALVQGWASGGTPNEGLGLRGAEGFTLTGRRFASSEAGATGPTLTVEFIPEPASVILAVMAGGCAAMFKRRRTSR